MADKDDKSHVKGFRRKRPGGGWTYVRPYQRRKRRGKQALAGGAVLVVALAGFMVYAQDGGQEPTGPPSPAPASIVPSE